MSLFKIFPWFSYQCPDNGENYDSFSITCSRLSFDSESNDDKIVVTSHTGFISILQPFKEMPNESQDEQPVQQPSASSVIYEANMGQPILGVMSGVFMPK